MRRAQARPWCRRGESQASFLARGDPRRLRGADVPRGQPITKHHRWPEPLRHRLPAAEFADELEYVGRDDEYDIFKRGLLWFLVHRGEACTATVEGLRELVDDAKVKEFLRTTSASLLGLALNFRCGDSPGSTCIYLVRGETIDIRQLRTELDAFLVGRQGHCFGLLLDTELTGFKRVGSDRATALEESDRSP